MEIWVIGKGRQYFSEKADCEQVIDDIHGNDTIS